MKKVKTLKAMALSGLLLLGASLVPIQKADAGIAALATGVSALTKTGIICGQEGAGERFPCTDFAGLTLTAGGITMSLLSIAMMIPVEHSVGAASNSQGLLIGGIALLVLEEEGLFPAGTNDAFNSLDIATQAAVLEVLSDKTLSDEEKIAWAQEMDVELGQ